MIGVGYLVIRLDSRVTMIYESFAVQECSAANTLETQHTRVTIKHCVQDFIDMSVCEGFLPSKIIDAFRADGCEATSMQNACHGAQTVLEQLCR